MSKEIESLKRIETTFSMNKQGKESVYREYTNSVYPYYEDFDLVIKALERLESIDNTDPSVALKCLIGLEKEITQRDDYNFLKIKFDIIKNALLKQQEQKKYLKWEDLEFKKEIQDIPVLLNGNLYFVNYYADSETEVVMIKTTYTTIFVLDAYSIDDKQFFNDLHLERVEE